MGQVNDSERLHINLKYYQDRRPELHEREIIEIKEMFDSLNPENGQIRVDDVQKYYYNSLEL
eukprot:CAMPEP_0114575398 /NCGR_PEP_ID=MMETSP0125-20121206/278_1 /TAXON_ID=485358 ORGANISM="Aristerostoma sp., Strain ATCC 50986" /NCGR_SAMPLE_ID=MMETSP0125 /ASSEMBLY_ACC=CAM_ASM_000245 /LENGTH=61 /DNA_ID=CAMNT_0001763109 /DNA_START=266 /DNA_END=451 /DNA_ORIENTATION=+